MRFILIFILFFLVPFFGVSQSFSEEEQKQIDEFNVVISNEKSHDTSLALAYVGLSEFLYVSNFDTLQYLCENAKKYCRKWI